MRNDYDSDEGMQEQSGRKEKQDKPRKRELIGFSKLFDPGSKRTYFVEYQPDDSERALELDTFLRQEGRELNFTSVLNVCSSVGVRARVVQAGAYVGHIFEDGSVDTKVEKELGDC